MKYTKIFPAVSLVKLMITWRDQTDRAPYEKRFDKHEYDFQILIHCNYLSNTTA